MGRLVCFPCRSMRPTVALLCGSAVVLTRFAVGVQFGEMTGVKGQGRSGAYTGGVGEVRAEQADRLLFPEQLASPSPGSEDPPQCCRVTGSGPSLPGSARVFDRRGCTFSEVTPLVACAEPVFQESLTVSGLLMAPLLVCVQITSVFSLPR